MQNEDLSAYALSAVQSHESATHEALFFFNSNSVGMFGVCLCANYGRMPDPRERWRDGSYGTGVRVTARALKSGGNPLPTAHDVITLPARRREGRGAVIADLGPRRLLQFDIRILLLP